MSTEQLVPTVIRLPADMHAALKARSEADDRTMAQTVRRALRQYLADNPPPSTTRSDT